MNLRISIKRGYTAFSLVAYFIMIAYDRSVAPGIFDEIEAEVRKLKTLQNPNARTYMTYNKLVA